MNSELGIDITVYKDKLNDCYSIELSNGYDAFRGAISFNDLKRLSADITNLINLEEERKKINAKAYN